MFVTILNILSNAKTFNEAQIALSQLESIKSRHRLSDAKIKTEVWDKLDPYQKRLIDNKFQSLIPQPNDWITHPTTGTGFILKIEENQAQIYWASAHDATQYRQGNFVSGISWVLISELKLISPPAHLKQLQRGYQAYLNLSEDESLIADFVEMAETVQDEPEALKNYCSFLREAYASGELTKQQISKIYQRIPVEIQRKIDRIKQTDNR